VSVTDCPKVGFALEVVNVWLGVSLFTTCVSPAEVLLESPVELGVKTAVIVCEPTASVLIASVALSELTVTGDPVGVPSTLNCTVPAGVRFPVVSAMVAVKVTLWPLSEGFSDEVTVVEVVSAVPVPETAMLCVAADALSELSVNTTEPLKAPAPVGVKSVLSEHSAPWARLLADELLVSDGQLLLLSFSNPVGNAALLPDVGAFIVSDSLPILTTSASLGLSVLVAPAAVVANWNEGALNLRTLFSR
jgi:hypothetical protein